jgi:hypothetical protein
MRLLKVSAFVLSMVFCFSAAYAAPGDLCAGKKAGSVTFFAQEISRDKALPAAVSSFDGTAPMFALLCLTRPAGPQETGGEAFRIVLYVDGTQKGVFRPQLSKPRKDIILAISENFEDEVKDLASGSHELRFQAATEKGNGKGEVEVNLDTGNVHAQELRDASYVADGKITIKVAKED